MRKQKISNKNSFLRKGRNLKGRERKATCFQMQALYIYIYISLLLLVPW